MSYTVEILGYPPGSDIWIFKQSGATAATCSGSSQTCTLHVSPTCEVGSGICVGVILASANMSGAGLYISSVSTGSGTGTWIVPSACQVVSASQVESLSCAYNLNETPGDTTITVTWNANNSTAPGFAYYEAYRTTGMPTLDGVGHATNATSASPTGPPLTLSGSNDYIVQGIVHATEQGVSAPYAFSRLAYYAAGFGAYAMNTITQPITWTQNATTTLVNAVAIK